MTTSSKPRKRDRLDPRRVQIKGKTLWQIDLGSEVRDGRRNRLRRTFADRAQAETYSRLKKIERENRGTHSISMPERLRGEAIEADALLQPFGASILDATREYVARRELLARSETVSKGVQAFLALKRADGMRPRYLEDLRSRLGRFVESFGERKAAEIEPAELDEWLRELGQSALSRNTFHLRLHTFFKFARQRHWVEVNPLGDVPRAKVTLGVPGVLSAEQAARLLETATEKTLPYWALGLFCGLRSAELARLEWKDIHFDEGLVEVTSLKSKTASRRFVSVRPNLAAWLEPYRDCRGKVCFDGMYRRLVEDRKRAGINQWPNNALRHSFASYHLAHFRDVKELALEMGHTRSEVTFRFYRELVKPAEAERFWRIAPTVYGESIVAVA